MSTSVVVLDGLSIIDTDEHKRVSVLGGAIYDFTIGSVIVVGNLVATGGPVIGGDALIEGLFTLSMEGSGGLTFGGSAPISFVNITDYTAFVANGMVIVDTGYDVGIVRDGFIFDYAYEVNQSVKVTGSGGMLIGGSADIEMSGGIQSLTVVATGGTVIGGSADMLVGSGTIADGGFIIGGSADMGGLASTNCVADGGFVIGGSGNPKSYRAIKRRVAFIS